MQISEVVPSVDTVWLPYHGDFQVQIRHNDEVVARKISEFCASSEIGSRRRGGNFLDDLDIERLTDAYAEYLIVDWKGLTDSEKKPMLCSLENRKLILHKNIDFRRWVGEESQRVKNFIPKPEPEEEKKSVNSSISKPTPIETAPVAVAR